jgi:hypothetical protein
MEVFNGTTQVDSRADKASTGALARACSMTAGPLQRVYRKAAARACGLAQPRALHRDVTNYTCRCR